MATAKTLAEVVAKATEDVAAAEKRVTNAAIAEAKKNVPLATIAETVGVSYVTLRKRLEAAGYEVQTKRGRKSAFTEDEQVKMVSLVVDNGEDRTKVAAENGVREGTLYSWQKKHRPESIRTRGEAEDVPAALEAEDETADPFAEVDALTV